MMKIAELEVRPASVSTLPCHSGDGYGYGGGAILTIGDRAIPFGEGYEAHRLATEIAKRWNAASAQAEGDGQ